MYKWSVREAKKYLYFRPKVRGDKDILLAGQMQMKQVGQPGQDSATPFFEAHTSHLMCFVGGMVGLGAQTLKLEGDLNVAKKLTDGCVWAYNVTTTGLMPEEFNVMKCPFEGVCKFSEEEWLREAFPYPFQSQKLDRLPPEATALPPAPEDNPMVIANLNKNFDKRDGAGSEQPSPLEMARGQALAARRPPGMLSINDGRYILRPEAIESVFYMYRITGNTEWQDKGWNMFESAIKATKVKYGHSAINNVFAAQSEISHEDSMESFWLAETLKYFYLLYSEPDVVSLDDYVFNTEAHPFKRPKA
jgi:mannosyl-oligosaccharide alpha-1,2-mannosidase